MTSGQQYSMAAGTLFFACCQRHSLIWAFSPHVLRFLSFGVLLVFGLLGNVKAPAQVAITEVMSYASDRSNATIIAYQSDFWELHNFSTNAVNMDGYLFSDKDKKWPEGATNQPFVGLVIKPAETILFIRNDGKTKDSNHFFAIWGETNFPPEKPRVVFYPKENGLNEFGDSVIIGDVMGNIIDRVNFGEAKRGFTFINDSNGFLHQITKPGMPRVWKAAYSDDYGSPGYVTDEPIPIQITRHPQGTNAKAGYPDLQLQASATGLPRPRCHWYKNETNLVAAYTDHLDFSVVLPEHGGRYTAVFENGLQQTASVIATLTVDSTPYPPMIHSNVYDPFFPPYYPVTIYTNQQFTTSARISGWPLPNIQWLFEPVGKRRVILQDDDYFSGTTNSLTRTLTKLDAHFEDSGFYIITASNYLGTIGFSNHLYLNVRTKPNLQITELMALSAINETNPDPRRWWELTSFELQNVNLRGWRWDDGPGDIGGGPTITNDITIHPGESIIFADAMSREAFIDWWGASNLPPNLQVVTYFANGLNENGEEVTLWNQAAVTNVDYISRVTYSTAYPGVSYWFATWHPTAKYGVPSVPGIDLAFVAAKNGDVGSPGWYHLVNKIKTLEILPATGVKLSWNTQVDTTNEIRFSTACDSTNWQVLGRYLATNTFMTVTDTNALGGQRFYRINFEPIINIPMP